MCEDFAICACDVPFMLIFHRKFSALFLSSQKEEKFSESLSRVGTKLVQMLSKLTQCLSCYCATFGKDCNSEAVTRVWLSLCHFSSKYVILLIFPSSTGKTWDQFPEHHPSSVQQWMLWQVPQQTFPCTQLLWAVRRHLLQWEPGSKCSLGWKDATILQPTLCWRL